MQYVTNILKFVDCVIILFVIMNYGNVTIARLINAKTVQLNIEKIKTFLILYIAQNALPPSIAND